LCEFIEDCEHTSLAVRILHLLGKEGPFSKTPSKYIRFVYNRVILENATVRSAAVAALAQFGANCPDLLPNILVLLNRSQMDGDDEVRDRATYYLQILGSNNFHLKKNYIVENDLVSLPLLEKALKEHLNGSLDEPFDILVVPKSVPVQEEVHSDAMIVTNANKAPRVTREEANVEKLLQIPGIQRLGPLHKSSVPVQLTENETEYTVSCIKHCFSHHIVFQFDCVNTLSDQLLEQVKVDLVAPEGFTVRAVIPCPKLAYGEKESNYVIVEFPPDVGNSTATFGATLKFIVKDCDPTTGQPDSEDGYDDEYILEDLEISIADQVQKTKKNNFSVAWDSADTEEWVEAEDTYALASVSTIQDAVNTILKFLGLGAANLTEKVPEGTHTHTLLCSGIFRGNIEILVRAKLAFADEVTMQLTVRSTDPDVAELITSSVG